VRLSISGRVVEIAYKDVAIPTPDFIRLAREIGYDGVELRLTQLHPDMSDNEIDTVAGALRSTEAAFTRYLTSKVGDEEQWGQFARCVGLAKHLGAESVGIWVSDIPWTQRCCELLADHDLPLVLQTHSGPFIGTPEDCGSFLEAVDRPNLRFMYDPSHFYAAGKPYGAEVIARFRDVIAGFGFQKYGVEDRDGKKHYRILPWDSPKGVRIEEAIAGMRQVGFDGLITIIEPRDEKRSPQEQMQYYYDHVTRLLSA